MQSARTLPLRTRPNRITKPIQNKFHIMSSPFYPSQHHHHHRRQQPHGHSSRGVVPYYSQGPVSLTTAPWASSDPFAFAFDQPFHQPFLSLFNDTFSQLNRLSTELNSHLNTAFAGQNAEAGSDGSMLMWAPKFDIKETDNSYVLEGELPGIERKNIGIEWVDDNTVVVRGRTEMYREEGKKPKAIADSTSIAESSGAISTETAKGKDASNSTAAASATNAASDSDKDTMSTTTNTNTTSDVGKQSQAQAQPTYHLTERTVGSFQRIFSFPGEVQHDAVKASLKNGVLMVTVPKVVKDPAQKKQARTVEVEEVKDEADMETDKMQS